MRATRDFKDYELLDCSGGEKLERWGKYILIRPDPQIIWDTPRGPEWGHAAAHYHRAASGGGSWEFKNLPQSEWQVGWQSLVFKVSPTGFKHTGLFPEQAANWALMREKIEGRAAPTSVLNLFAYTGGATLACASAGASVCHVDASKGMVQWARENAGLSGLTERPIRWIVDDCKKFVEREIRRGVRYDCVIMDPPSYGRGPGGEIWKLEEQIYALLTLTCDIMSDKPLFFMLNSYTTGLSASVMQYLLGVTLGARFGGRVYSDEVGLPVTKSEMILPCGSTAVWEA